MQGKMVLLQALNCNQKKVNKKNATYACIPNINTITVTRLFFYFWIGAYTPMQDRG